jgi:selenocysteine lyase/cysteine desulfurase
MSEHSKITFANVRELFPHTKNITYFNAAAVGPFSTAVQAAVEEHLRMRVTSEKDDSHTGFGTADELRGIYAGLVGAEHRHIGLGSNTSFGLNLAAYGLPLKAGDEILVSDIEFPAAVYTAKAAAATRGLTVKFVKSVDRRFDLDEFEKAITPKSGMLMISFVQFFDGYKIDLEAVGKICKEHGIFLVADGIQGMGAEVIDIPSLGIDIFASGCQKWMLSPQGCGFFYVSDEVRDRITPPFMSWVGADWKMQYTDMFHYDKPYFETARRFEMGYYAVLNFVGMKAAVRPFVDLGIAEIQRHNHALIDRLAEYIRSNPYYRITSSIDPKHRSSIFTFSCADLELLHKELLRRRIILVRREGSIRVSVHLYNNEADIDKLIETMAAFSDGR